MSTKFKYHWQTIVFLSPWLIIFIAFQIYPIVYSLAVSFTDFKAISINPPSFIGIKNYFKLFSNRDFKDAFYNSIIFVLGTVPFTMILSILVAFMLNRPLKLKNFYSLAFFAPTVTSVFVISTLFIEIYSANGLFNQILNFLGFESLGWLKDPNTSLLSIMIMNVWASFGFYALVFLAILQTVPKEQYEIAQIEGAGFWRQLFSITLPHLKNSIILMTIINSILAFQIFGEIYIMTKGGPINSTKTVVYFIYDEAFSNQKMGYASAAGYLVFLFLLVFSLLQIFLLKPKNR